MRALPNTTACGIALMSAAMLLAPLLDVLAKLLTETVSPAQAALGRFGAQTLILLGILAAFGGWARPGPLHALAGVFLGIALCSINIALAVMPVANAIAIFFVEPLILTLLSALVLGERLGWRRIAACAVGLAGALIVLRPNLAAFGPAAAMPLVTAVSFAAYVIVNRVMSQRGRLLALQFWTGLFALLTLVALTILGQPLGLQVLALGPFGWHEAGLMAAMGAVACFTHQLIVQALARAEAGAVAPLQYLEIISATALGWLVFADFPDALTWAGTAIIVAAGIYVFQRERLAAAPAPPPPPTPTI